MCDIPNWVKNLTLFAETRIPTFDNWRFGPQQWERDGLTSSSSSRSEERPPPEKSTGERGDRAPGAERGRKSQRSDVEMGEVVAESLLFPDSPIIRAPRSQQANPFGGRSPQSPLVPRLPVGRGGLLPASSSLQDSALPANGFSSLGSLSGIDDPVLHPKRTPVIKNSYQNFQSRETNTQFDYLALIERSSGRVAVGPALPPGTHRKFGREDAWYIPGAYQPVPGFDTHSGSTWILPEGSGFGFSAGERAALGAERASRAKFAVFLGQKKSGGVAGVVVPGSVAAVLNQDSSARSLEQLGRLMNRKYVLVGNEDTKKDSEPASSNTGAGPTISSGTTGGSSGGGVTTGFATSTGGGISAKEDTLQKDLAERVRLSKASSSCRTAEKAEHENRGAIQAVLGLRTDATTIFNVVQDSSTPWVCSYEGNSAAVNKAARNREKEAQRLHDALGTGPVLTRALYGSRWRPTLFEQVVRAAPNGLDRNKIAAVLQPLGIQLQKKVLVVRGTAGGVITAQGQKAAGSGVRDKDLCEVKLLGDCTARLALAAAVVLWYWLVDKSHPREDLSATNVLWIKGDAEC